MSRKNQVVRKDASQMYALVELYLESGLTQKQFCMEMDIAQHTFTYWLTKYRKSKQIKNKPSHAKSFMALEVSPPTTDQKSTQRIIRVIYPGGTTVELPV